MNYTFRMHDPRVGRFFAKDPLLKKYPYLTPYQFSSNQPIHAQELEGCESASEITPTAGISLNFGSNNNSISFTASATGNIANWQGSAGLGISYFLSFANTGKSGIELRGSLLGGFNDGQTNITLGTNLFRGLGGMSEFSQRTGILNIGVGKFNFSYENDGFPFNLGEEKNGAPWLSDGNDSYRTAAVRLNYGNISAGFNLFTGYRSDYSNDANEMKKGVQIGTFGEKMPWGYVKETGTPYRMGAAFISYGATKIGVDSDRWIRHAIQDNWAHDMKFPFDTTQPGFKSLSKDINPFIQFMSNPQLKAPKFTLYDF